MNPQSSHDHDPHDHPHAEIGQAGRPGYYDIMETAVRELLVETAAVRRRRDPPPDRGAGFAHAGTRRQGRGARLGRSRVQGAAARRRARGLRGAGHQLLRRHRAHRPGEHRPGPQPDRLHALLLLPAAGAGAAAGLVQAEAVPRPRGGRSRGRCWPSSAPSSPTRSRSASAIPRRWCATSSCRSGRTAPRTTREEQLAALVTRDTMIGVVAGHHPDREHRQ